MFWGLVWAWAHMGHSPLQLHWRVRKSCQELLPLMEWLLHCCTWRGQLERKNKDKNKLGWQGDMMGSVLTKKEQAWLPGDEEEGPSATPHEGVLVWHLGWLEEVQHPPSCCTASLLPAEPSSFQVQHKGSNHTGGRSGRSVPALCHSCVHRARCPGTPEPPSSSCPRARLPQLPAAGTGTRAPGPCPAGQGVTGTWARHQAG